MSTIAKPLRCNELIRISPVRVIDEETKEQQVMSTDTALELARSKGMDLVEVGPTETPPVCRIMDYGRFKYHQKKKNKQKNQHAHHTILKEIRLRPRTDNNDRRIKIDRAKHFLDDGYKVQFTMLFRGRERVHSNLGMRTFDDILEEFGDAIRLERAAKVEGRRMTMVVSPAKH